MKTELEKILKDASPEQKKQIGEMVNKFTEMVKIGKTTEAMNYLQHMKKQAQEKLKA